MEIELNSQNFESEVLKSDKPVIVDFWAVWCGPCRMLAPEIEKIANEYPTIKVCKLNVDEATDIAVKYGVEVIPTVIKFINGEVVKRTVGYDKADALIKELEL